MPECMETTDLVMLCAAALSGGADSAEAKLQCELWLAERASSPPNKRMQTIKRWRVRRFATDCLAFGPEFKAAPGLLSSMLFLWCQQRKYVPISGAALAIELKARGAFKRSGTWYGVRIAQVNSLARGREI